MTHPLCSLLHWLAAKPDREFSLIIIPDLCATIPRALELDLVETDPRDPTAMGRIRVRLTELGRTAVAEGKLAMEGVS
jgi:hypothetical protein